MFDPHNADHDDLRGGTAPWRQPEKRPARRRFANDVTCDVAVIGAGITGALAAEHLTSLGYTVAILDRETPGLGSTAASTALLQWEIDCSLRDLTAAYGFERAAAAFRRSYEAAEGLQNLVRSLRIDCAMRPRASLYLSADDVGATELQAEHRLRDRAGLPGGFLDHRALLAAFNIEREAALLSSGSAEADPLCLALCLLQVAVNRGAQLFEAQAEEFHNDGRRVVVTTGSRHVVVASHVLLATGYAMPGIVKSDLHSTASTWAMATPPQPDRLWPDGVLIWEASRQYHYARTTVAGRIIIGGEDEDDITEPDWRDALIPAKTAALRRALQDLWPRATDTTDHAWSGAFGKTVDGLPLIGALPANPRIFAAYGYGGNGITFSFLASRMIAAMLRGRHEDWFETFALDRPVGPEV